MQNIASTSTNFAAKDYARKLHIGSPPWTSPWAGASPPPRGLACLRNPHVNEMDDIETAKK